MPWSAGSISEGIRCILTVEIRRWRSLRDFECNRDITPTIFRVGIGGNQNDPNNSIVRRPLAKVFLQIIALPLSSLGTETRLNLQDCRECSLCGKSCRQLSLAYRRGNNFS